jgi:hypothetical protein
VLSGVIGTPAKGCDGEDDVDDDGNVVGCGGLVLVAIGATLGRACGVAPRTRFVCFGGDTVIFGIGC